MLPITIHDHCQWFGWKCWCQRSILVHGSVVSIVFQWFISLSCFQPRSEEWVETQVSHILEMGRCPRRRMLSVSKHGQICGLVLVWHGSLFIQSHRCWMKLLPTTSPTRKPPRVLGETAGFVNTENGCKDLQLLHVRPRAKAALPGGEGRSREATRSSHPKRILHGCSAVIWRCGDA